MSEAGFLDPGAVRRAMRRIVLRGRLELVVASATALLDCLDHGRNASSDGGPALLDGRVNLAAGDDESAVGRVAIDLVERQNVREQELLEGAQLMLQLLDAMREGIGHGLFSGQSRAEPIAAEGAAHRLCETLK